MIIGLCGLAGSGKSTVARLLVKNHCFESMSLADPMKEFCAKVLGFSKEQLWGASALRNEADPRYGKSPREALQTLGTEWGRTFYLDMWIDFALNKARAQCANILGSGCVFEDVRFHNEADAIRKAGGKVWRIVRPGAGLSGPAGEHQSETELTDFDPYDRVIDNRNGSLEDLASHIAKIIGGKA